MNKKIEYINKGILTETREGIFILQLCQLSTADTIILFNCLLTQDGIDKLAKLLKKFASDDEPLDGVS